MQSQMLATDSTYIKVKDTTSCPQGDYNLVRNIDMATIIKYNGSIRD